VRIAVIVCARSLAAVQNAVRHSLTSFSWLMCLVYDAPRVLEARALTERQELIRQC
jgi:hypothetical protein